MVEPPASHHAVPTMTHALRFQLKVPVSDLLAVLRARLYLRGCTFRGSRIRAWGRLHVRNAGRLYVGSRVRFVGTLVPVELAVESGATLSIGERSYINYGCSIAATERVVIGPNCRIGTFVNIMDNSFHRLEPEQRDERPPSAAVTLEENVWLGARSMVLPGVTIGAHSVIGAGSVVTSSIPPRCLAVGTPARVIRSL